MLVEEAVAMMTSTDVRRFVDHALGLANSGDLDGLAGLFDPNVVMVGPDDTVKGSEAVRAAFDVLYTAFPGLQVEINKLIVEDDWVAYTATATGTHGGPLRLADGRVIAPTNRPVTLRMVNVRQVKDGRLTYIENSWDRLHLLSQMGLLPASGG
jgi:ketosteroid isomerase-like protein